MRTTSKIRTTSKMKIPSKNIYFGRIFPRRGGGYTLSRKIIYFSQKIKFVKSWGGGIDQKNIYDSPDPPPGGHPTPFHSEQVLGHSALGLSARCRCKRKCEFSLDEVVFSAIPA